MSRKKNLLDENMRLGTGIEIHGRALEQADKHRARAVSERLHPYAQIRSKENYQKMIQDFKSKNPPPLTHLL